MSEIHTRSSIPLPADAEGPMPTPAEEPVSHEPVISARFAQGNEGYFTLVWRRFRRSIVGMIGLAVWARSKERTMLAAALDDAAARGLIPATDIGWLVDLRARRIARKHARAQGGEQAVRAMRDYQQAAIELGFLHHRLLRGTAPKDYQARGQHFLTRIQASRPAFAFPGQVVPTR